MTAQDLWQAHYKILLMIFLRELIKLNVNTNTVIKNMKIAGLKISIAADLLNTQTLKMIQKNRYVYAVTNIINKSLMKS